MARSLIVLVVLASVGCVAPDRGPKQLPPLHFALIPAPQVGADPVAEELLYEVVTQLSTLEIELTFCFVPGPLLGVSEPEAAESLVAALGSVAAPTFVALAASDQPQVELLEALKEGLNEHPGLVAYWGKPRRTVQPLVLGPEGELPAEPAAEEGPSNGRLQVALQAASNVAGEYGLEITSGAELRFERVGKTVHVVLPPLSQAPNLYATLELGGSSLVLRLHSASGSQTPPAPPPLSLTLSE